MKARAWISSMTPPCYRPLAPSSGHDHEAAPPVAIPAVPCKHYASKCCRGAQRRRRSARARKARAAGRALLGALGCGQVREATCFGVVRSALVGSGQPRCQHGAHSCKQQRRMHWSRVPCCYASGTSAHVPRLTGTHRPDFEEIVELLSAMTLTLREHASSRLSNSGAPNRRCSPQEPQSVARAANSEASQPSTPDATAVACIDGHCTAP